MHSDVGGGYAHGEGGKDYVEGRVAVDGDVTVEGQAIPSKKLAQVPLVDMHYQALKAGVPLKHWNEIVADQKLSEQFQCHSQLIQDYNDWLFNHGVTGGSPDEQIKAHTRQYVKWKGSLLREGSTYLTRQPFYRRAKRKEQRDLLDANKYLEELVDKFTKIEEYIKERNKEREEQNARHAEDRAIRDKNLAELRARGVNVPEHPLPVWHYDPIPLEAVLGADAKELYDAVRDDTPLAACSRKLFDEYVHDSLAMFKMLNWTELDFPVLSTNGYLRYRTVFNAESPQMPQRCVPGG